MGFREPGLKKSWDEWCQPCGIRWVNHGGNSCPRCGAEGRFFRPSHFWMVVVAGLIMLALTLGTALDL